jgi:RNA polymerase sigma factor (sigma-70 family)
LNPSSRDDGTPASDWECLELAHRGDEGAWRALFVRHERRLARMAALITGSPDAAQDIAQETFVRVLRRKIPRRDGSFGAYLTTVAFRLALRERARRARHRGFDEGAFPARAESPLEAAVRSGREEMVAGVLAGLPPDQREVIALRFYGDHSYAEIAAITGVPEGTVKSRIFYALKHCRSQFRLKIPEEFPGRPQ